VALSRADAKTLGALLGAPVTVVRNAPPAPPPSTGALDWPDGKTRVLSVGRLETQKGFDRMLRALATPQVKALAWHWNVIGEGSERAALTGLVSALGLAGRVTLVGARPGVDGLRDAELLLAPSRFEGMPLVPMEAAEARVPVLASTIDPHEELYEGVAGALLPRDEGEWPGELARWLGGSELRQRVGEAQRAVIGDDPRGRWFADYEALYRAVMEEG